jgi:peptidoglycan/LPS O-acetylase OafA/YrhL
MTTLPLPNLARTPVRRLHALTTLRFIAAAAVVLNHSASNGILPATAFDPFLLFQAVSFFFVLSGFILAYVYPALDSWPARGRFLLARFARVWPAHIASLLLLVLLLRHPLGYQARSVADWLSPLLLNVFMLQSWLPTPRAYYSFNAVSWSISTEFGFYLLFPLLIHRWSRSWWWKLPLAAALSAVMIFLGNRPGVPAFALPTSDQLDRVTAVGLVYTNPLARLFEFTLGMSVALLWRRTSAFRIRRPLATLLELAACALVVVNMFYSDRLTTWAAAAPIVGEAGKQWLQQAGTVCLSFALLVYVMAREEGWISRALSAPLGVLLGEISFSVYLMHQILLDWYAAHVRQFAAVPTWLAYSFYWALMLLASYLIWAAIERPFRKAIVQHWPPWRRRPGAGPAEARHALEVPGGRARSRFAVLLDPGPRVIATTALLVAGLAAVALYHDHVVRGAQRRAAAALEASLVQALPQSRNVKFGNEFLLAGAVFSRRSDGGLDMMLTWQALKATTLRYQVAVHLLAGDRIVNQADHPQDVQQRRVTTDETWTDLVHLPPLGDAAEVGIALHTGDGHALLPDHGVRDWGGNRLRLPLPAAATGPAAPR